MQHRTYTKKKFIAYLMLVMFLTFASLATKTVANVFHEKWLERGSAYDVEMESLYTNILRRIREITYSPGSQLDLYLLQLQKQQTDKAFKSIPESDGERTIWKLWEDQEFWYKLNNNLDTPSTMKKALAYFEDISTIPMKSEWAKKEQLLFSIKFSGYFYNHELDSNMASSEIEFWRWKIARNMNALSSNLNNEIFLNYKDVRVIAPLSLEHEILGVTWKLLKDNETNKIKCNEEAINMFQRAHSRIVGLLVFYEEYELDDQALISIEAIKRNIAKDPEKIIQKQCKL